VPDIDTVRTWQGRTLVDRDGNRSGTGDAIYLGRTPAGGQRHHYDDTYQGGVSQSRQRQGDASRSEAGTPIGNARAG
jgi:hypothetical protein